MAGFFCVQNRKWRRHGMFLFHAAVLLMGFCAAIVLQRLCFLLVQAAEQEGHDLGAGAVIAGAEGGSTGSAGDAVFSSPQNCGVVVGVSRHVGEGIPLSAAGDL